MTKKIVEAADRMGAAYASMLLGDADLTDVVTAVNELTDLLKAFGSEGSHYVNAALLTGAFQSYSSLVSGPKDGAELDSKVYALYSSETGLTKIGVTRRLDKRIKEISGMSPDSLEVIKTWSGGQKDEAGLHYRYRKFRSHGEWFALPLDIRETLAALETLD